MNHLIAIDGPAASGKSTVARILASELGFVYVNTGAMYRAFAWAAIREGIDCQSRTAIKTLTEKIRFEIITDALETHLRLDGIDPTPHLRDKQVNDTVAVISGIPELREFLVNRQRQLRLIASLVMEGRDIGTVVASDTPYKFYLDAREDIRSARRQEQGEADSLSRRDAQDRQRTSSPMIRAADAEIVDSSGMTIEEVIEYLLSRLKAKGLNTQK